MFYQYLVHLHVDFHMKKESTKNLANSTMCGEVEVLVGALTPLFAGVAQVFHDLLVELQLLFVAGVEEGEKEDRQEEGDEVNEGSQGEETTTTWMAMVME